MSCAVGAGGLHSTTIHAGIDHKLEVHPCRCKNSHANSSDFSHVFDARSGLQAFAFGPAAFAESGRKAQQFLGTGVCILHHTRASTVFEPKEVTDFVGDEFAPESKGVRAQEARATQAEGRDDSRPPAPVGQAKHRMIPIARQACRDVRLCQADDLGCPTRTHPSERHTEPLRPVTLVTLAVRPPGYGSCTKQAKVEAIRLLELVLQCPEPPLAQATT